MSKVPIHFQIIIALILGASFGALFPVNQNKLNVKYQNENGKMYEKVISNWDQIIIKAEDGKETKFSKNDFTYIISKCSRISISDIKVLKNKKTYIFTNVKKIAKVSTIATQIKPIGDLFIRLLSFMAIPLVIATLIGGVASLGDISKLGRIGGRTIFLYIITTAIAIAIGLFVANIIKPGETIPVKDKIKLTKIFEENSEKKDEISNDFNLVEFFLEIVPKNPFQAIANGNMLQLIFFAIIFGLSLSLIPPDKSKPLIDFFNGMGDTMIRMVDLIMKIAPLGVFALISSTVADFGINIIFTLFWYMMTVFIGLLIHITIVYLPLLKFLGNANIIKFFINMKEAIIIAFSTSSSAATLPVTMQCVENYGVKKSIYSFVLPLGATVNMDGTALYQGVAAVFISQVYGMDLTLIQQLTILITAIMASIGTAPVPGVGIIMLVMILNSVGIPTEGIALILGVDRILDMARTVPNIIGDSTVSVIINNLEEKRLAKS